MKPNNNSRTISELEPFEPKGNETLLDHLLANGWEVVPKCEKTGDLLWYK